MRQRQAGKLIPMPTPDRSDKRGGYHCSSVDYSDALTLSDNDVWGFMCPKCNRFEEGWKGAKNEVGKKKAIAAYRAHKLECRFAQQETA